MKNKFLKFTLLITLSIILIFSLVACGSSSTISDDNGGWGGISWVYTKDNKTLTITGSGKMPDAATEADVDWAHIRSGVEKVIFVEKDGNFVDSIGDYAFYGMYSLKSVSLPSSVTSIGKLAFAYCSSLETITLPNGITNIGESAFEMCAALKSVTLPSALTSLGDRAFAICTTLESVKFTASDVEGTEKIMSIGNNTFISCDKLTTVSVPNGFTPTINGVAADKIKSYDPDQEQAPATTPDDTVTDATDAPKTTDPATEVPNTTEQITDTAPADDNGVNAGTIISLIVLGVVIVGICVGAVLLVRSNKNQANGAKKNSAKGKKK